MSTNNNLFKEAIADAKAVREAALKNAKAALEEALTPKLQSMLAAKLQEMDLNEEEDEQLEEVDYSSDFHATDDIWHTKAHQAGAADAIGEAKKDEEKEELEEEFDLSEILAELDEAKEEEEEEESEEEESEETEEEETEEEMDVADMSVEDLKDLIKDIVAQEVGGTEAPAEEEPTMDMGAEAGEEAGAEAGAEDEIDLEELLAELDELDEADDKDEMYEAKKKKSKKDEEEKDKKEMKEALETIEILRNELNEVNLLNAKLLYVNKIFKAKNLTESQKLQVIASFDKATNVKEAKVVFESLQSTLTAAPAKKAIKESLGFASKAAGVAPKKSIVESNDVISRMQKLANIK